MPWQRSANSYKTLECSVIKVHRRELWTFGPVYKERGLPQEAIYPRKRVTLACIFSFLLRRVYNAARVFRVGELPYLRARVTLTGGLTFCLVNTLGRVTLGLSRVPWGGTRDKRGKTTAGYLVS